MNSIVLVGNPNTGKSSLFNLLCKLKQKTANYPGVTVEKKIGYFSYKGEKVEVIDAPGTYGLQGSSKDEKVIHDILLGHIEKTPQPDLIILTLDHSSIKRSLYLLSQVIELEIPILITVTMSDLSESSNIDFESLSQKLQIPILQTSIKDAKSIEKLKEAILKKHSFSKPHTISQNSILQIWEKEVNKILPQNIALTSFEIYSLLLTPSKQLEKQMKKKSPKIEQSLVKLKEQFQKEHKNLPSIYTVTQQRYSWVNSILKEVIKSSNKEHSKWQFFLDQFLMNKWLGILFFIGITFLIFEATYTWSLPFMDLIEYFFSQISNIISQFVKPNTILNSLLTDGIVTGISSILVFIPQIAILFFLVSILEESGYLARMTFLSDQLLVPAGLNGRSFIPLLSSFACAIPGIKQARTIEDERTRLLTILIAPMMSCSARLPVYIFFISIFIEPVWGTLGAVLSLFFMHLIGPLFAIPISFIINKTLTIKEQTSSLFLQTIPPYRIPILRNVLLRTFIAVKSFVIQAGGLIFIFSIIIWFFTYFPRPNISLFTPNSTNLQTESTHTLNDSDIEKIESKHENLTANSLLENSFLGQFGKFIQPIFSPLGYDWKLTVSILAAFPARELIVPTLGIIYNIEEDSMEIKSLEKQAPQTVKSIFSNIKDKKGNPIYNIWTAISIMIFFALCCQCLSTLAVVRQELNSYKWPIFIFIYMTSLAYISSLLVYQIGTKFIS